MRLSFWSDMHLLNVNQGLLNVSLSSNKFVRYFSVSFGRMLSKDHSRNPHPQLFIFITCLPPNPASRMIILSLSLLWQAFLLHLIQPQSQMKTGLGLFHTRNAPILKMSSTTVRYCPQGNLYANISLSIEETMLFCSILHAIIQSPCMLPRILNPVIWPSNQ